MKKFDLCQALLDKGFEVGTDAFGRTCLTKTFTETAEVAFYGSCESRYSVVAAFNSDRSIVQVYYFRNSRQVKTKTHLTDKRTYNAIIATVKNAGFEL